MAKDKKCTCTDKKELCTCKNGKCTCEGKETICICEEKKGVHKKPCNGRTEVYSRVVGYIRPTDDWNDAKKEEFDERKTYKVDDECSNVFDDDKENSEDEG